MSNPAAGQMPFVHLHCHSHYSLLDGAGTIGGLIERAKATGHERPGPDRPRQSARGAGVLPDGQGAGHQSDPRHRGLHRPRQPLPQGGRRHEGGQLPPHAAGPEPHGLSEPRQALLGGLSGRLLFQAAHRQGAAGRPQRRADLPERLRLQRVEPRAAGRRRRPTWRRPARSPPGSTRSSATATSSRSRTTAWKSQRLAMEGGRSSSPAGWACPWWPPATSTTSSARTPRPRTSCCASTRASSAPTPTACGWRATSSISAAPRRCTRPFPACDEALRPQPEIADSVNIELELGKRHFPVYTPPDGKTSEDYLRELCLDGLKRALRRRSRSGCADGQLSRRGHGPAGARAGRDQQAGLRQLLSDRLGLRPLRPRAGHSGHGPRLGRRLAGVPTPCT